MRRIAIGIALLALLLFIERQGFFATVESRVGKIFLFAARPFAAFHVALSRSRASLRTQESGAIERELQIAKAQIAGLKEEKTALETLLKYAPRAGAQIHTARILGYPSASRESLLLLDQGSADGVHAGDIVVAEEGVLIGKIIFAAPLVSTARLLTDPESKIAVSTVHTPKTVGVAEGVQGLTIALTLVPQGIELEPDVGVITSGLEAGIPRGLYVGTIERVEGAPTDAFRRAIIRPAIMPENLVVVGILASKTQ